MYSSIPTRQKRTKMLIRIKQTLSPEGYFICQFRWNPAEEVSGPAETARKCFAFLTRGNRWYETGDQLWGNAEFVHVFFKKADLESEFNAGGFEVVYFQVCDETMTGGAILK